MKELLSPLTKSTNVRLVKHISKQRIINDYNKKFNINVERFFKDINKVAIFECTETGYRFFYPFNLWGDSKFYEHFQEFDWYYMPWKWEHEITKKYIKDGISLLEVGCAQGAFIKKINELFSLSETVGLELNESAKTKNEKWSIINQTIQSYSETNKEKFDIVCSYQVLEHISDVNSFIAAKVDCLKKGGKLIISVPNNDSFIKDADNCLNEPPHHMGLWNEKSLRKLETLFPIKVVDVHLEELQDYHVEPYVSTIYYSKYKFNLLKKVIRKLHKLFGIYKSRVKSIHANREKSLGHTILLVYEKV